MQTKPYVANEAPSARRRGVALAALTAALGLLAGCGNSGADTSCSDFQAQSGDDQRETITKLLEDKDVKTEGFFGGAKIGGARVAVQAFCASSSGDRKIGEITNLGG